MVKIFDHGTWPLGEADEGVHPAGGERLWSESFYLDFTAEDGSVAGYVRLGLYPNWDRAWYWACLVGRDRPLVLLADDRAPLPGPGLAVRGRDYRATQEVTAPMRSFRLTLEAGAAAVLEDPWRACADPGGDPGGGATTSLEFDLEWETVGGVYPYGFIPRYEIPCRVGGVIRVGGEEIPFFGYGERDHSWGERDWWKVSWLWSSGRLDDGTFFHGMRANVGFEMPWPCFTVSPDGLLDHREGFTAATEFGEDGFPALSRLAVPGSPMTAVPVAFAPVAMTSPDGAVARFPRALCRFEAEDGRRGYGWTEWHQPPGWREHGWR
ncbi:hypothetical protein [Streptosporangium roseum]|uniref:DUF7064 domain-containing protein n=1 Tax=Streptosporangium roseum (strain ATCC 12428 / DSM 43021 / JCM 3005 / KCTC 9067 / NCIMB 10171 / NRRL 2505 / NI 9100) TaxID=479432 RepID=D2B2E3_STRRD|nr:hypothetical protein [Streptosporangium roseum]ACZ91169.1 hypothetical protein Sros_8526 [Streptosporangium roseum DSM 43021]